MKPRLVRQASARRASALVSEMSCTRSMPLRRALGLQLVAVVGRHVRHDQPGRTGARRVGAEARDAVALDDRRVGHRDQRHFRTEPRARRSQHLEAARRRHAGLQGRAGPRAGSWARRRADPRTGCRPRSRSRRPATAAAASSGSCRRPSGRSRARACAASPAAPADHRVDVLVAAAREARPARPRPARVRAPARSAANRAWEDSSAGMMPSLRHRRWKDASASSSLTRTYSARPLSASWACSGPTPGIVEPRGDGVALRDLAPLVAEHVEREPCSTETRPPPIEAACRSAPSPPASAPIRRTGSSRNAWNVPDRVRPAADAGHDRVRQPPACAEHLGPRLAADHRLQLAHERGVGVRAGGRADQVVGRLDVRDPVADGLVHGLLERRRARRDGHDRRAQQVHARDVGRLAPGVLLAHVDDALEPEARAHGRAGDAMLARARLGDDALLAEPPREQRLADGVVDLVRARVREVFALEPDARAADLRR